MMYFLTFYLVHNQVKHAFSTISPAPPKVTNWPLSYTLSLVFAVGFGEGMDGDSQGSELLGAVCCGVDSIWEMLLKKNVIKQFHRIESILDPGTTSH